MASYKIKAGDTLREIAIREFGIDPNDTEAIRDFYREVGPQLASGNVDRIRVGETISFGEDDTDTGGTAEGETPAEDVGIVRDIDRQFPGVVTVGDITIPQGATLIVVSPRGGEVGAQYVLSYQTAYGVTLYFEIGDQERFDELFPSGREVFADVQTMDHVKFGATLNDPGVVQAGDVDEILGATESLERQIDRELRLLQEEDVAPWLRQDVQAMALVATGAVEGWSSGRLWNELSKTDAFRTRFSAIDVYTSQGMTVEAAVSAYVDEEERLTAGIRRFRGGTFQITNEYLGELIATGWTSDSIIPVLEAEARLMSNPEALAQANAILLASGLDPLDEAGMVGVIQGSAPLEVIEALNTAAAASALADVGLGDIDIDLLMDVVDDVSKLRTPEDFKEVASQLSLNAVKYGRELARERYGLDTEDLVAAFFGEESPTGKTPGDVFNLLAKFDRERRAAAAGFEDVSAYVDARNRLRVQGFAGL